MLAAAPESPPPPIGRGTPAFARMIVAMIAAGFSTFALLYCVQPLLPLFAVQFGRSPAEASLAVSAATIVLAIALLFVSVVSDRTPRRSMMIVALTSAAVLTLVVAMAPNWPLLLLARALTGLALAGVPAVVLTYLGEEVESDSLGLAVGLHIGGNVVGGMSGRLITGVLADHLGWRGAVGVMGVMGLVAAALLAVSLPHSRRFQPKARSLSATLYGFAAPFRDAGLPWLFLEAFLCFGAFVSIYNFIGFRLLGPPYNLSQTAVGLIFALYLLGVVSSAWIGDVAGRLGRRRVFWAPIALMVMGVGLTAARPLGLVIVGVGVLTFGFFGAHSTASSWVGRRAGAGRAQATAVFLFFYYMGASLVGPISGLAWERWGWNGVTGLLEALLALALLVSVRLVFLQPLPVNLPTAGAQELGA